MNRTLVRRSSGPSLLFAPTWRWVRWTLPWLAVGALSACGGGGGAPADNVAAARPADAAASTALGSFTTQGGVPESFRAPMRVPSDQIAALAAGLPASTQPSYLRLWVDPPAGGAPDVLYLGRWTPGQTSPLLQPLRAVGVVHIELYNDAGAVVGQWSLQ